jgi:hypothetical protein
MLSSYQENEELFMVGKYAFSLNGERYRGSFNAREEAVAEALDAARRSPDDPQTVFVGRRIPGDSKASGHARAVLSHMAARAREQFGDAASDYLTNLAKPQIDTLDETLEMVILGWLEHNELMPTFFKMEAIGEYPVPATVSVRSNAETREVHEIGGGGYEM